MCEWKQIQTYDWHTFPKLARKSPCSTSGGKEWWTSACPLEGGEDRMRIFPDGAKGQPHIWCQHCDMWCKIGNGEARAPSVYKPPEPLPLDLGAIYHDGLTQERRQFFRLRGISDIWIDLARLGWTGDSEKYKFRYSIPCYDTARNLWAVQYRHANPAYRGDYKYISQAGGHNDRLFVPALYAMPKLPYVVLTESPLDALTWCSHGVPAFAPFAGNNIHKAWKAEWNGFLPETVIIIAQNDGGIGADIAEKRMKLIGRGEIRVAKGAKDESAMFAKGIDLAKWLGMPVISTLTNGRRN